MYVIFIILVKNVHQRTYKTSNYAIIWKTFDGNSLVFLCAYKVQVFY